MPAPPHMKLNSPPFRDLPTLLALARFPNVSLKMIGTPALSLGPYPFSDLWPSLHRIIDAFGPERLMWGSDFPRCAGLHTRAEAIDYVLRTHEVSEHEQQLIFGMNLRRIMRWSRPS
jgi:predicted TIM-barrel fold metal-dependent hydrolase